MSVPENLPGNVVDALMMLLEEEKETNFDVVRQRLIEMGPSVIPRLKEVSRGRSSPLVVKRTAEVIGTIKLYALDQDWENYAESDSPSLEAGLFLLARFHAPDLNPIPHQRELDRMADILRERISHDVSVSATIASFNQYLFYERHFSGNRAEYYLPENSYIHTLLQSKKGIPISLSALYLILAQRLSLPIYGIGMPGHFLIQWFDQQHKIYIDPFDKGRILTEDDLKAWLVKDGVAFKAAYLQRVTTCQILVRMMNNLIYIYQQRGEGGKAAWLSRFQQRLQRVNKGRDGLS